MNLNKRMVVWLSMYVMFCLFNNVLSDFYDTPGGAWPSSIEIGVGDSANISCWMNPAKFSNNTVKDLYFENINTRERVPKSEIIILNETAIVWILRDAKEQKTTYRCKCGEKAIMDVKAYIGYKPLEVNDFTCRSYDYSRMQCNFTKPDNPVLTLYNVSFHFATNYRNYPLCNFERTPLVICEIEKDSAGIRIYRANQEIYHFTLIGINHLGELTQNFPINNYKIMVPVKPGADFHPIQITSNSASFSFRMPKNYPSKSLQWEVILKPLNFSAYNVSNAVRSSDRNEFILSFKNLNYAYYEYQLYLRVCLREAQLWSDPFIHKFRTAPRRPRAPRIDVGSFYIDPLETTIRLYWELLQPHEFDGDNFSYVIENENGERISTNNNSASFLWEKTLKFEFNLYSKNHFGLSDEFSKITIPAMLPYGKSKTHTTPAVHNIYHGTNGTYTLTWEAPEITNNLIDYTVFWCRSKRASYNDCEGSIHFKHVSRDVQKFTTASQEHTLNLAVSANYKDFNTGMHWTECTMNEESDLVKMEPEVEAISATAIKIQWGSENICPSIFERYNLSYCEVESEPEIIENSDTIEIDYINGIYNNHRNRDCIEDTIRYVLINKTIHRWELHDLKPYTSYKIEMFMYSLRKLGKTSDPQYVLTDEGAPSPPRQLNVSNITNTSAIISWLPPREPNGKIRTYTIVLNNERRQIPADPNDLYGRIVYDMKDLNSSTSYKVYVLAGTVLSSQPSNDIHFTTHVGYPSMPREVTVKDSHNGAVIEWAKATERTDFYEVAITVMQNDKIVKRRISIVMGSNFCVFNVPQCLDPNYRTTVDVRAVNAALLSHEVSDTEIDKSYNSFKNDELYYKDNNELHCIVKNGMTEKQITSMQQREQELYDRFNGEKYRLFKSNWQRGTSYNCSSSALGMIFVYIASAVLITVGAFVLMYLMRQKYNKMANIHCTLPAGLDAYMSKDFSNMNGTFPHDFIAVIKGEMSNSRTEENNITMHRNEKHNEERLLLETTSQDSFSISNEIQAQKQTHQHEQSPTKNEPLPALSVVDLKSFNEIGIISNPINDSNFDLTSLSKTESDFNDYIIQPLTETNVMPSITATSSPYIQTNEIATTTTSAATTIPFPQPTQNCYIKANSLSNWHNIITAEPSTTLNPTNGYVTIDNIPRPVSKITSNENNLPTNNGYIQTNVLLDSIKPNLNTQSNALRNVESPTLSPQTTAADSYTTFEQLNKMSTALPTNNRPSNASSNLGLPPLETNFTPGISGYVTHRELNEFGRQHQQSNLN